MKLTNRQIQANLKFIEFSCKKDEQEFDEEKEAIINKAENEGCIKVAHDLMYLNHSQKQFIFDGRRKRKHEYDKN